MSEIDEKTRDEVYRLIALKRLLKGDCQLESELQCHVESKLRQIRDILNSKKQDGFRVIKGGE